MPFISTIANTKQLSFKQIIPFKLNRYLEAAYYMDRVK